MENSFKEQRQAGRAQAKIAVEILTGELAGTIVDTTNFSEAGTLINIMDGAEKLQPDMNLELRITGLMGQDPVLVLGRVARVDDNSVALEFKESL